MRDIQHPIKFASAPNPRIPEKRGIPSARARRFSCGSRSQSAWLAIRARTASPTIQSRRWSVIFFSRSFPRKSINRWWWLDRANYIHRVSVNRRRTILAYDSLFLLRTADWLAHFLCISTRSWACVGLIYYIVVNTHRERKFPTSTLPIHQSMRSLDRDSRHLCIFTLSKSPRFITLILLFETRALNSRAQENLRE